MGVNLEVIHKCLYQCGGEAVLSNLCESGPLLRLVLSTIQPPAPSILLIHYNYNSLISLTSPSYCHGIDIKQVLYPPR
jgi:hypothetical protein